MEELGKCIGMHIVSREKWCPESLLRDFPGGTVVKNPPANAGDNAGFKPWSGKISHAVEQPSPCATTTEPAL